MITFEHNGGFEKTENFFQRLLGISKLDERLNQLGREGVQALRASTPKDSGLTASSWYYVITKEEGRATIDFKNSNIQNGVPIAILIQYGHATNNGGYVQGVDYINPALKPVFEKFAEEAWKEVTKL